MTDKIEGTPENWENGLLGQDAAHAVRCSPQEEKELDEALGLEVVTLRLPKETVEMISVVAKIYGVNQQYLMRIALMTYVKETVGLISAAAMTDAMNRAKSGA